MYSCTPQISEMTRTIGWLLPLAGRASYTGTSKPATGILESPAARPSVSVLIACARTVSTLSAYPVNAVPVARTSRRVSMLTSSSGAQMAREELQAPLPGRRGRRRLIGRPVVGVECVARVGINDHLHVRVAGLREVDEPLHVLRPGAPVVGTAQAQERNAHVLGHVEAGRRAPVGGKRPRRRTVPGDGGA